ncbi:hypothetical protein MTO96_049647 [Rhipicephalus appendiculatus]
MHFVEVDFQFSLFISGRTPKTAKKSNVFRQAVGPFYVSEWNRVYGYQWGDERRSDMSQRSPQLTSALPVFTFAAQQRGPAANVT